MLIVRFYPIAKEFHSFVIRKQIFIYSKSGVLKIEETLQLIKSSRLWEILWPWETGTLKPNSGIQQRGCKYFLFGDHSYLGVFVCFPSLSLTYVLTFFFFFFRRSPNWLKSASLFWEANDSRKCQCRICAEICILFSMKKKTHVKYSK